MPYSPIEAIAKQAVVRKMYLIGNLLPFLMDRIIHTRNTKKESKPRIKVIVKRYCKVSPRSRRVFGIVLYQMLNGCVSTSVAQKDICKIGPIQLAQFNLCPINYNGSIKKFKLPIFTAPTKKALPAYCQQCLLDVIQVLP